MASYLTLLLVSLGVFTLSFAVTAFVRRIALYRAWLDVPNDRSSHVRPTPRGGGLGFVVAFFVATGLLWLRTPAHAGPWLALLGGGGLVALVGWLDDRYDLPAALRFGCHGLAAFGALYWLGGFSQVTLGTAVLSLGWGGNIFAWLFVVWTLNAYNFMDGIDGLAAGEAVLVALVAAGLLTLSGDTNLALTCLFLAVAVAGFLVWNWPPAKIFMGDVGSGLLGYTFAVLAIASQNQNALALPYWLLLLGVFYVDTGATLVMRVLRGERWYAAHRSHAYQRATQRGYRHVTVSLSLLLITLLLAALSTLGWRSPVLLSYLLLGAYLGLFLLWWRFAEPSRPPSSLGNVTDSGVHSDKST